MDRDRLLRAHGNDNLWSKRDKLSHERGDPLSLSLRVTLLDLKIPANDMTALA